VGHLAGVREYTGPIHLLLLLRSLRERRSYVVLLGLMASSLTSEFAGTQKLLARCLADVILITSTARGFASLNYRVRAIVQDFGLMFSNLFSQFWLCLHTITGCSCIVFVHVLLFGLTWFEIDVVCGFAHGRYIYG
jgi:hypothetical protein